MGYPSEFLDSKLTLLIAMAQVPISAYEPGNLTRWFGPVEGHREHSQQKLVRPHPQGTSRAGPSGRGKCGRTGEPRSSKPRNKFEKLRDRCPAGRVVIA